MIFFCFILTDMFCIFWERINFLGGISKRRQEILNESEELNYLKMLKLELRFGKLPQLLPYENHFSNLQHQLMILKNIMNVKKIVWSIENSFFRSSFLGSKYFRQNIDIYICFFHIFYYFTNIHIYNIYILFIYICVWGSPSREVKMEKSYCLVKWFSTYMIKYIQIYYHYYCHASQQKKLKIQSEMLAFNFSLFLFFLTSFSISVSWITSPNFS